MSVFIKVIEIDAFEKEVPTSLNVDDILEIHSTESSKSTRGNSWVETFLVGSLSIKEKVSGDVIQKLLSSDLGFISMEWQGTLSIFNANHFKKIYDLPLSDEGPKCAVIVKPSLGKDIGRRITFSCTAEELLSKIIAANHSVLGSAKMDLF